MPPLGGAPTKVPTAVSFVRSHAQLRQGVTHHVDTMANVHYAVYFMLLCSILYGK